MSNYSIFTDQDLIDLLRKGDDAAFTEIYNRYWEKMASYAIRLTKSSDEGADIIQEMFVSLWNRRESLEVKGTLISYLIKGTRNLSLKYIEKNLTKHQFLDRLSALSQNLGSEIEENLSAKELQKYVDGAVAKLPGKMKEIYLLSRDEQLSHREISQRLGIAEGTVKKQISNALKIISTHIKPNLSGAIYVILMHILKT